MKNLIYVIVFLALAASACEVKAQDVYGRAKNPDTTYLSPNDFNTGEVITVDTLGGNKIFIGTDIASALNAPDKLVFVILDTATGELPHRVISSNIADTTFILSANGDGSYDAIFAASIFANKRPVIKVGQSPVVFIGNWLDPSLTIRGYVFFYLNDHGVDSFPFSTLDESGNLEQGILQPGTIIEITLYPL